MTNGIPWVRLVPASVLGGISAGLIVYPVLLLFFFPLGPWAIYQFIASIIFGGIFILIAKYIWKPARNKKKGDPYFVFIFLVVLVVVAGGGFGASLGSMQKTNTPAQQGSVAPQYTPELTVTPDSVFVIIGYEGPWTGMISSGSNAKSVEGEGLVAYQIKNPGYLVSVSAAKWGEGELFVAILENEHCVDYRVNISDNGSCGNIGKYSLWY